MELQNSKDWAKVYRACNFLEKGVCEYADERVYLSQDALHRSLHTMKGRPVIIDHTTGITPENMHKHAVGYVIGADFNTLDGGCDCQFVVFDDKGKEVIADGYSVSCAYKPLAFGPGGTWHNVPYDREIVDFEFTHLALVQNPRYEDAKVYENSKGDKDGHWITVHPNGEDSKGRPLFIEDGETPKEAIERKFGDKAKRQASIQDDDAKKKEVSKTEEPQKAKEQSKAKSDFKKNIKTILSDQRVGSMKDVGKSVSMVGENGKTYKVKVGDLVSFRKYSFSEKDEYGIVTDEKYVMDLDGYGFEVYSIQNVIKDEGAIEASALQQMQKSIAKSQESIKEKDERAKLFVSFLKKNPNAYVVRDNHDNVYIYDDKPRYSESSGYYEEGDAKQLYVRGKQETGNFARETGDFKAFFERKLKQKAPSGGSTSWWKAQWLLDKLEKHNSIEADEEMENAKDKNGDEGKWITIKGTHVFIKDGQSVEEVIDQKFKGSEGHEAKRTSKIHQDIHDRYEALREETERQKKELKGKYEREDADFDEEQALKDIEEARSFGYETIDDVAEFLGLDPDEVTGLTGESYGDDDFQFKTSSEYKSKKHPDGIVLDLVGKEELIKGFKEASRGQTISKELEDKLSKEMQKYSNLPGWSDKFEQMWDEIDDYHDQWKAQSSTNGSNWSKSKYGNDWQLDQGDQTAKVSAKKDDGYVAKLWDSSTGKISEQKSFETKEDAMQWAEGKLKDKKQSNFDEEGGLKFKSDSEDEWNINKPEVFEKLSPQEKEQFQKAHYTWWAASELYDKLVTHKKYLKSPKAEKYRHELDDIHKDLFDKYSDLRFLRSHQTKLKQYEQVVRSAQNELKIALKYPWPDEVHNSIEEQPKEEIMNVEEFFNKMGEMIEEKFNACKGRMNEAEEADDDDKFEMDGEVYSKKELVNAFKEKKNAEMAEKEDEEEEKQNSADEFFNAMEERMAQQQQEASDKIEVYSQQKGLEKGKKIYG